MHTKCLLLDYYHLNNNQIMVELVVDYWRWSWRERPRARPRPRVRPLAAVIFLDPLLFLVPPWRWRWRWLDILDILYIINRKKNPPFEKRWSQNQPLGKIEPNQPLGKVEPNRNHFSPLF